MNDIQELWKRDLRKLLVLDGQQVQVRRCDRALVV